MKNKELVRLNIPQALFAEYQTFPNCYALCSELSWSYYRAFYQYGEKA